MTETTTIDIPKEVDGEVPVFINGKYYWQVKQMCKFTHKSVDTVRQLCSKGNRIRRLKHISFGRNLFIEAQELFEFPFLTGGRPSEEGDYYERFYMEDGELLRAEEILKREEASVEK